MTQTLLAGEYPLTDAPVTRIHPQLKATSQHYYRFEHTLQTAEAIIADIHYDQHFQLFVNQDNSGLYLQVGVIGFDNYKAPEQQNKPKIVYGRKWRIEPELPSSEIIQTAFLALEKAREHELRERFRLHHNQTVTTPLHGHHDLPLMAKIHQTTPGFFAHQKAESPIQAFSSISYDHCYFSEPQLTELSEDQWLCSLTLQTTSQTSLPELLELHQAKLHFISASTCSNELLMGLMDKLLQMSKHHLEEHFSYKGFKRFSREHDIKAIGQLSYSTRKESAMQASEGFKQRCHELNNKVDLMRVPRINLTPYGLRQLDFFRGIGALEGFEPIKPFASNSHAFKPPATSHQPTT